MSEIRPIAELQQNAKLAATAGKLPEHCLPRYQPDLHHVWLRFYNAHAEKVVEKRD